MFGGANPRQIPIVKTQKQKQNSCLLNFDVKEIFYLSEVLTNILQEAWWLELRATF